MCESLRCVVSGLPQSDGSSDLSLSFPAPAAGPQPQPQPELEEESIVLIAVGELAVHGSWQNIVSPVVE